MAGEIERTRKALQWDEAVVPEGFTTACERSAGDNEGRHG